MDSSKENKLENDFEIEFDKYNLNGKYEGHDLDEWEEIFNITEYPILVEYFTEYYDLPRLMPSVEGISEHTALIMRSINIFRYNPNILRILLFETILPKNSEGYRLERGKIVSINKKKVRGIYIINSSFISSTLYLIRSG